MIKIFKRLVNLSKKPNSSLQRIFFNIPLKKKCHMVRLNINKFKNLFLDIFISLNSAFNILFFCKKNYKEKFVAFAVAYGKISSSSFKIYILVYMNVYYVFLYSSLGSVMYPIILVESLLNKRVYVTMFYFVLLSFGFPLYIGSKYFKLDIWLYKVLGYSLVRSLCGNFSFKNWATKVVGFATGIGGLMGVNYVQHQEIKNFNDELHRDSCRYVKTYFEMHKCYPSEELQRLREQALSDRMLTLHKNSLSRLSIQEVKRLFMWSRRDD